MGKKIKKMNFWMRRRSNITLILIGGVMVSLLFLNDDASMKLNMEYQEQINSLRRQIRECEDSARWYSERRQALYIGTEDLEHVVREEYHMQKPTEDVFLIKSPAGK